MSEVKSIVIAVHGIRTFGQWQDRLKRLVKEVSPEIDVKNYRYGYFSVVAFLVPVVRWLAVRSFRHRLREVIAAHPRAAISIVAHSFGTHIAAHALRSMEADELPNIPILLLSGSVLPSNFDFSPLFSTGKLKCVVNDCGIEDSVLLLSQFCVLFTGMAGRVGFYGFSDDQLINRYHDGGHSLYFQPTGADPDAFMRTWWVGLLTDGEAIERIDARISEGALQGIAYTLIGLINPIKILAYVGVLFVLVFYGYAEPRREARLERDRRAYQAASTQITSGRLIPAAVDTLSRLVSQEAFPSPDEHARALDVARFGLQRLTKRAEAIAEMPDGRLFRSGTDIYVKGATVSRAALKSPMAQVPYPDAHAVVGIDLKTRKSGPDDITKEASIVVLDTITGQELVRTVLDLERGELDPDLRANGIVGAHRRLLLRLSIKEREGDESRAKIMAIDLDARSAALHNADRIALSRDCRSLAWKSDEDRHVVSRASIDDLFRDSLQWSDPPEPAEADPQYAGDGFDACFPALRSEPVRTLRLPRAIDEQRLVDVKISPTPSRGSQTTDACALAANLPDGSSLISNSGDLDRAQIGLAAGDGSGMSADWLREQTGDCLIKLTDSLGREHVATMSALGLWTGGWVICDLSAKRSITNCHVYAFASEGGGRIWHRSKDRFLIISDTFTETNDGGFTIVDLTDGRSRRPADPPDGQVRGAIGDEVTMSLAVVADVVGWPGAAEVSIYDLSGATARLVGRRRFNGGTALDSATRSEPDPQMSAPALHAFGGQFVLWTPQTIVGLDLRVPNRWKGIFSASGAGDQHASDSAIAVKWVVPLKGDQAPPIAARADGSFFAVVDGAAVLLVLTSDGTTLGRIPDISVLNPTCSGKPTSVEVDAEDRVTVQAGECRATRAPPPSRDEMVRSAQDINQFWDRLD